MVSFVPKRKEAVIDIMSEALMTSHYHSAIRDHHEAALILHESTWNKFRSVSLHQNEFGPLTGITFDVPLEIEVSGYLAPMVEEMANQNVSIVPQCALIYDHIFIRTDDQLMATTIINNIHNQACRALT